MKKGDEYVCRGGVFQQRGTASAKALRLKSAWCVPGAARKPAGLEPSERGEEWRETGQRGKEGPTTQGLVGLVRTSASVLSALGHMAVF